MTQTEQSELEADELLARQLMTILRDLPPAYAQLVWFLEPGSRPTDQGSRQRHGDAVRDPLRLAVEDLLSERVKPGAYPVRLDPDRGIDQVLEDQVWDRERGEDGEWVTARRQGVRPTLAQWSRLVDGELWDAGIEHDEYGLQPCGHLCWLAPVRARLDDREGPCSQHPDSPISPAQHWTRPTVAEECAWLTDHAAWIIEQEWAEVVLTDLRRLLTDVQAVIGELERPEKLTCLTPGCGWPVREQQGGAYYKCSGCGKSYGRIELHRMAERKKPKTLTELVGPTGLSIITLRRYKDAGKFEALPERRGNAEQYDLEQVMAATMAERYKPERGRRGRFRRKAAESA